MPNPILQSSQFSQLLHHANGESAGKEEGEERIVPSYPCIVSTARMSWRRCSWVWSTLLLLGRLSCRLNRGRKAAVQAGWATPGWNTSEVLVERQWTLVRGGRQKMIGTALGNLGRPPHQCLLFTWLLPCHPNILFPLNLSTPLGLLQPLQKWSLVNMSEMDKISWFVPYSHDGNTSAVYITEETWVWSGSLCKCHPNKRLVRHFEWALLLPYFTQFTYPCFKLLLITWLEYSSYRVYRFISNVYQHLLLYQKFHVILFL